MNAKLTTMVCLLIVLTFGVSQVVGQAVPTPQPPPVRPIVVATPDLCPTVIIYQRGAADGFAPGIDPVHPSLALSAFLSSIALPGHPPVAYDDAADCDHPFGDSFKLDECVFCCGICSATLEVTLRGCGSALDCNDSITVGQAPFNSSSGYVVWNGYINGTGCPSDPPLDPSGTPPNVDLVRAPGNGAVIRRAVSPTTSTIVKTIQLDPRRLAELVCHRQVKELDVYIEDDQIIDFMRLIITKP